MAYPSKKDFIQQAGDRMIVPVYTEILADMETPVSAFKKIDDGKFSFLLESVEGGENLARYSFLGSNPSLIFKTKDSGVELLKNGQS